MDRRTIHQRIDIALAQQQHAGEFIDIVDVEALQVAINVGHSFPKLRQAHLHRPRRAHQDDEMGRELREIPGGRVREDTVERGDQGAQVVE